MAYDPRLPVSMPDLGAAYMRGVQIRSAQAQEAQQRAQLAELYDQRERESKERRELGYYAQTGNFEALRRGSPIAAQQVAQQEFRQKQNDAELASIAKDRARATANTQRMVAAQLERNPDMAPLLRERVAEMARGGVIDAFEVPDYSMPQGAVGPRMVPNADLDAMRADADVRSSMFPDEQDPQQAKTREQLNYEAEQKDPGFKAYRESLKPKPKAPKGPDFAKIGDELRKEFQNSPVYKDTQQLATAYEKIRNSGDDGAGDMGLVFGFMKLLDPGSTVREGEFDNARKLGGLTDWMQTSLSQLESKRILTTEQRERFKREASGLFASQLSRYRQQAKQYEELAKRRGASPGDVVLDQGFDAQVAPPSPVAPDDPIRARFNARKNGGQ